MKIFRIIVRTIGILIIGYFVVVLIVYTPFFRDYKNRIEFDSEKWKNWEESEMELTLRWDMVSDLNSDYDLKGMSKKEIENLLGKPDKAYNDGYSYYLGLLGIHTGRLYLTFKNGIVTDFRVHRG